MARIAKSGLEYFPFDIDFFQDIRIRKLIKRQGGKAVTVYALLLCLIYKNGYYMQWDDELPFIGSEMSGFDEAYVSEVIKTCLSLGLFDKTLYETEDILTSKGIQVRYCNIQRLNKRMSRIDKYSLLEEPQRKTQTQSKTKTKAAKENKQPAPIAPVVPAVPVQVSEPGDNAKWLIEFFADNHSENLNLLCKNFGLGYSDIDRLRNLADAVVAEWELSHTVHRDYSDWSKHLISAMRIKNRDAASTKKNQSQQSEPPTSDYSYKGGFGGQDV
ncbi:DUF4373 domain-containing protein [Duncaniella muris]|uniref:DUF4373 domain-containing protein n=1 Tax=Duncaniella muris TaxID=2094150 RepID=UPI0026744D6C|nr:DUF4373 domain-containing protein [Duncaniella muris]